jgi:TonB-dependent heme/hemoglobin receptor
MTLAGTAGVVPAADAQETDQRALETIQVTATRRLEPAFDVAVATTVVSREEIRAATPQTVMDLLRRHPGTYVQQTTPGQGVVIVRGLKGSEVLQVVDGFRLNNAIFRNAPNQYVALVDSQLLERIEVVRGPMSALYGSDAMGGVVQMLSWEPGFAGIDWSATGELRAIYGSADDSTLSRLEGAAGRDGVTLSGGMTYQNVEEREAGGGETLPFTGYTSRAADAKLRARVAEGHELMVSAQYAEQPRTPRHDELTPGFGQAQPNSSVYLFAPQRRDLVQVRWRGSNSNALWDDAEAHLGRQQMQDDRRTRDFGSTNEDTEINIDTSWGLTWQAGKALSEGHYLTWGADYYDDRIDSSRRRRNIETGATSARAPRFPDGSTMQQLGVFAADDWSLGKRLDLLAALRWSDVRTHLPATAGFAAVSVEDDDFSGNLGLALRLREDVRLVANLGRGFRAPNVFDLGAFGDRPGNRFSIPNADLAPETVTTLDTGVKFSTNRLQGELIGYYSRYDDKITSVLTGDVTSSGRLVVQNRNATKLDIYGIESGLRAEVRDGLELYANATWTHGEETLGTDNYPADRIPPLYGSAGAEWRFRPDLVLEAYASYAGPQNRYSPRDEVDPRIEPGGTAGWTSWNARVAWQATDRLHAALQLTNLSDRRYREFGSGIDAAGFGWAATVELKL